jgi:hypothetical protein
MGSATTCEGQISAIESPQRRPLSTTWPDHSAPGYNSLVRRVTLALIVALLSLSASGVQALVVPETCELYEQSGGAEDRDCSPTCVTCRCCGQAVEPLVFPLSSSPSPRVGDVGPPLLALTGAPADILHVPKSILAA